MRYYGWALEGTYDDKHNFFFSLIPAVGFSREGEDFWSLQITWLNFMLGFFTGIDNGEEE